MYLASFLSIDRQKGIYKHLILLSFIVFCLSGCHIMDANSQMDIAERNMSEHPDCALSILQSMDRTSLLPGRQTARHALLLSMALDKNYMDVTNDSTVSIALDYYLRHGGKRSRMLSYYYSGVVHQNGGNNLRAAVEFDKALDLAQELKDNHHAGLACNHLSSIHRNNYNHAQALDYSKRAESFFDSCGETLSADYARADVAS